VKILVVVGTLALLSVLAWLGMRAKASEEPAAATTTFVFVKIPESILPVERGSKYEDPLDESLRQAGLGEVTGGGSQLGNPNPDGSPHVEWVGIDVELENLETGLPALKRELLRLGAPGTTVLEYRVDGKDVSEAIQ